MPAFDQLKRALVQLLGLAPVMTLSVPGAFAADNSSDPAITRIAFGSCAHQDKPQRIWDAILATAPDMFVFLGDNIYGDTDDMQVMAAKYAQLEAKPGFQQLRRTTEIHAIWDDHDFGRNDAGREYPMKAQSRQLMLDFWNEPAGSPRRTQADGIYTSCMRGPAGRTVQLILPDLRWDRTALELVDSDTYEARDALNMGPYRINTDPQARLMGEQQWAWLEQQFTVQADVRIIGSSIQCLPEFSGWETWANFPFERERLLALLALHQDVPTLILSGDVHWCEYTEFHDPRFSGALPELTSSGLTEVWEQISPNRHRAGEAFATENFGLIEIDWDLYRMQLSVRDKTGRILINHTQHLRHVV